jgi:DNA processing protein
VDEFAGVVVPEPPPEAAGTGTLPVARAADEPVPEGLPEAEKAALMHVGFEPTAVDVVAGRSGSPVRELLPALAMLELKGYVRREAGGLFVRVPMGSSRGAR